VTREDGSQVFEAYTTSNGLANNNVKGLLEDDLGNLWISTLNGLSCYDKTNNRFTNYYKEDGLVSNQFYWNAYCKAKSGLLLLWDPGWFSGGQSGNNQATRYALPGHVNRFPREQ